MLEGERGMKTYLQKIGKSLMLPIAVLPVAGLTIGIGYWLQSYALVPVIATFLNAAGSAIINHLPVLFAVGIALGMSKEKDGAAALSGLTAFLVVTTVLSDTSVAGYQGIKVAAVNPAFVKIDNAFIGILSGIIASEMYNRFSKVQLPQVFAFFSGKRLAPIMSAVAMLLASVVLFFIWPVVYTALVDFGEVIAKLGPLGAGIYGMCNRLLIPTGLHHALNSVFWFDVAGINDIGNFWASKGTKGITGMYQAGMFPMMMFGLPAGALAIYQQARPEKKKMVGSLMLATAFTAFFTGITEPLEFSFMFVAPALFIVHAFLTGVSMFIAAAFHWTAGFNFSAGLIDYLLSLKVPIANKPYMLLVLGLVMAVVYYVVFTFMIRTFNLMTPGREVEEEILPETDSDPENKFAQKAEIILQGLNGWDNIISLDYCATRLRLEIKEMDQVDEKKLKTAGIAGINKIDSKNIQVIVGTQVQFVADEMNKLK